MRTTRIFHPLFAYHPRATLQTSMMNLIEIYEPNGNAPSDWIEGQPAGTGMDNYTLVWRGRARIQPNNDWRARVRDVAGDLDATQAVRVQIPILSNQLNPTASEDPHFAKDWLVRIVETAVLGTESLQDRDMFIRNAINSGNKWQHNLLCDVGTSNG